MTPRQLTDTQIHYESMFGDVMSDESVEILRNVTDIRELEDVRELLSAGEFDAAEAIILEL